MVSAPWIWPMMMSCLALGTCSTDTVAWRVCPPEPAAKLLRLSSSVRECAEFGVVAPATGAQNFRLPSGFFVIQGAVLPCSGLATLAAVPLSDLTGMVSFQPASL